MTTGETIVLTRRTFVGNVMPLLFNMLSRFAIAFLPKSKHLWPSLFLSGKIAVPKDVCFWTRRSNRNWIYPTTWFLKWAKYMKQCWTYSWKMESKWCTSVIVPVKSLREFPGHSAERGNQKRDCEITHIEDMELSSGRTRWLLLVGKNIGKEDCAGQPGDLQRTSPRTFSCLLISVHM